MTRKRAFPGKPSMLVAAAAVLVVAAVALAVIFASSGGGGGAKQAIIIDQLADTAPNPAFAEQARSKLEAAGYEVEYVSGAEVNVDLYRHLPDRGHDLVIVRAHSGRLQVEGQSVESDSPEFSDDAALFTSEPWSRDRYHQEQVERKLSIARYDVSSEPSLFGVTPKFIRESMRGHFGGATVILMGCDGLRGSALAAAFRDRGAVDVVGWDELVTAQRTDGATLRLLDHLLAGERAADAVTATMSEVGTDAEHGSTLLVYGSEQPLAPDPLPPREQ